MSQIQAQALGTNKVAHKTEIEGGLHEARENSSNMSTPSFWDKFKAINLIYGVRYAVPTLRILGSSWINIVSYLEYN